MKLKLGASWRQILLVAACLSLAFAVVALAAEPKSNSNSSSASRSTATQSRQSPLSVASSLVGAVGSLVPSLISNVAPLVLLFGLGAMMMPGFSASALGLFREARRSGHNEQPLPLAGQMPQMFMNSPFAHYVAANGRPIQSTPQDIYYFTKRSFPSLMSSVNSGPVLAGLQDLLERVGRAIENADKRYN